MHDAYHSSYFSGRLHVDIIETPRQSLPLSSFCLWPFCYCCKIPLKQLGGNVSIYLGEPKIENPKKKKRKERKPFRMLSCYWVLFILPTGLSNSLLLLKALSAFIYTVKTYFDELLRNRRNSYLETCFPHALLPCLKTYLQIYTLCQQKQEMTRGGGTVHYQFIRCPLSTSLVTTQFLVLSTVALTLSVFPKGGFQLVGIPLKYKSTNITPTF